MSKVLIIAPHPDDEIIGCGGTIQYHINKKDDVFVHIIGNRVINHVEDEEYIKKTVGQACKAATFLGVKKIFFSNLRDEQIGIKPIDVIVPIEQMIGKIKPEIVYIPNDTDTDQDHRVVAYACKVACRTIPKILSYEILGSTRDFTPNLYINIKKFFPHKIKALRFYKGQMHPFPHPRSPEALDALARIRGVESKLFMAEAFRLIKDVVK